MASKRRIRRQSCGSKIRYTHPDALKQAAHMRRVKREFVHAYLCKFCKHWHIGHWKDGSF